MKNLTKLFLGAVSLLGVGSAPALAQDDAPQFSLAGSVAVTSDYKFRGISQNDREPSPQGSLTLTGPEGFYVSAWGPSAASQTGKFNCSNMSTVVMRISATSSTTSTLPRRASALAWAGTGLDAEIAPRAVPAKTLRSFRANSSLR